MKRLMFSAMLYAVLLALTACAPKTGVTPLPKDVSLAVVAFEQPTHSWELLAGNLPDEHVVLPKKVLGSMDAELDAQLTRRTGRAHIGPGVVRQCQEILLAKQNRSRPSAFTFWQEVGECVPADYLLVPQVFQWEERSGNDWSVNTPAQVVFDLYLIDIKNKTVTRAHYEEQQHSLSENVLDAGTFFKRGGKWITAEQMSREGLTYCLEELGL